MFFKPFLYFLFSIVVVHAAPASGPARRADDTILTADVDAYIENVLTQWGSPGGVGVAVVALDGNGTWTVETKGYGNATASGVPIDSDTMFCIGSNSKVL